MKLVRLRLKNFRGYQDSGWIVFENLTAFAGKNDVGKSTILEALDIFFNAGKSGKRKVKISGEDRCVLSKEGDVEIRCCFLCDGERVVIDDKGETTLKDECVVNSDGLLEIAKRYSGEGMKESVFLAADYPTCAEYQDVFMNWVAD